MKAQERQSQLGEDVSALADVPLSLPALVRAQKLQKRAARVGFDWPSIDAVRLGLFKFRNFLDHFGTHAINRGPVKTDSR